jgi:putative transposase
VAHRRVVEALDVPPTLGIDLGLTAFAATSEGEIVQPLKALAKQQVRLRRYQRSVSRKVQGSANRKKAVARLGALHRRIAHQRSDWLHKLTTDLADRHV